MPEEKVEDYTRGEQDRQKRPRWEFGSRRSSSKSRVGQSSSIAQAPHENREQDGKQGTSREQTETATQTGLTKDLW